MRVGSVCSGIEAAAVAWHPLGWSFAFSSDIDPFANAVRAHHYPEVPNFGDMTKFKDWPDATIDLLVGGTPCQAFSVAGLRKGLADPRGNLTLTFLAVAARYRPEWLVWENVPGVLSDREAFGAFLGGLSELGYGWAYRVLDAQYFGLAQRRKRVFVVASLGGWQRAAAVLFEPASLSGHPAPRREAREGASAPTARSVAIRGRDGVPTAELGEDVANAILTPNGGRAGVGVGAVLTGADLARCVTTGEGTRQDYETTPLVAHALRAEGFDASEDGTGRGTPLVPVHAFDARQSDVIQYGDMAGPLDTDGHTTAVATTFDWQAGGGGNDQSFRGKSRSYITDPPERTRALTAAKTLAVQQAMQVRRLTPREFERLQGFPDDYTLIPYRGKPAADGPRYKALGNSMAVPVMSWIGRRIQIVHNATQTEAVAA